MSDRSTTEHELLERWSELVETAGAPQRAIDQLLVRHREAHRRYHTAEHVLALLRHLDSLDPSADPAARLAAFYHDAIYETTSRTSDESNESLSAQLAATELAHCTPGLVQRVAALIRATEGHQLIDDVSAAGFLDADLAILGSDPARYGIYAAQIRQEYAHIADDRFRSGRSAVLEGLLSRDVLYYSPQGQELWEQAARNNMTAELAALNA